jgi:hypothetical protein
MLIKTIQKVDRYILWLSKHRYMLSECELIDTENIMIQNIHPTLTPLGKIRFKT